MSTAEISVWRSSQAVKHNLRVAVISGDRTISSHLVTWLQGRGHQPLEFVADENVLGALYFDPPDAVIIDLEDAGSDMQQLIAELKADSYFSMLPLIGLFGNALPEDVDWEDYPLDDFLVRPLGHKEILNRVDLSVQRIRRVLDNNPLTKLPGNTSIQNAIESRLGNDAAVCYIDINNFKPYNDTYGFSRGDEVIRMVARIMANAVREAGHGGFSGHVGGDDFVFIVKLDAAETVSQKIIDHFGVVATDLFGEEEKAKGYYVANDRLGNQQHIPLLGLAIAIVPLNTPKMTHSGKVAEVAAEMKKFAKKSGKSCFVVDRRKS